MNTNEMLIQKCQTRIDLLTARDYSTNVHIIAKLKRRIRKAKRELNPIMQINNIIKENRT